MIEIEIIETNINTNSVRMAIKKAGKYATNDIKDLVIRQIPNEYTISESDVRKYGRIKTSSNETDAEVRAYGERVKLIHFKHNPDRNTTRNDRVSAEVRRGEEVSKYPAFIRKKQIFQRIGQKRLPIKVKKGSSVPEMMKTTEVRDRIEKEMLIKWRKAFNEAMR